MDEAQKEEMKREKRRIQEQLRRIKRNQERERFSNNTKPQPGKFITLNAFNHRYYISCYILRFWLLHGQQEQLFE